MKKSDTIESVQKKYNETMKKLLDGNTKPEEKERLRTFLAVYNGKLKRLKGERK